MKVKKLALVLSIIAAFSLVLAACGKKEEVKKVNYPTKTIKIVHYLPPNTPPDLMTKKLAELMEKKKGWKFEFANEPGNMGGDAENKVWAAQHDGYTVFGQTENTLGFSTYGVTPRTSKDWVYFESFQETTGILVKSDSRFKSIQELVEAAKAKPGTIKVGTPGEGMSFHLKLKVLEMVSGAKFDHKAYLGGIGLIDALYNGDIDAMLIPTGVGYQEMVNGKLRALAVTEEHPYDFGGSVGTVDSIIKAYPDFKKYLPLDAVAGLALPADTPKEVINEFGKAFEEVMNSPEMDELIAQRGATKINLWGEDAKEYMKRMESNFAWVTKEAGLSKVDPATLGIPRP